MRRSRRAKKGTVSVGSRNGMIRLRWRHIDLERRVVTVAESLSRAEDGNSASCRRQRKATKTGKLRTVGLHPNLAAVLAQRKPPTAKPDDLVFLGSRGNPWGMWRVKAWWVSLRVFGY